MRSANAPDEPKQSPGGVQEEAVFERKSILLDIISEISSSYYLIKQFRGHLVVLVVLCFGVEVVITCLRSHS